MSVLNLKSEAPTTNRAAIVEIPTSMIARLLMLPDGVESTRVSYEIYGDKLVVLVQGDGLPEAYEIGADRTISRAMVFFKQTKATTLDDTPREIWATEFEGIY